MFQVLYDKSIVRAADGAHIPTDHANTDYQAVLAWVAAGNELREVQRSAVDVQSEIVADVQRLLDNWAQVRGYDSILSACTYADSAVPRFAAEGRAARDARDMTWAALWEVLAQVTAGTRPVPRGLADIEHELPPLAWSE